MADKLNGFQIAFTLIYTSLLGAPAGAIAGTVYQIRLTGITRGGKE